MGVVRENREILRELGTAEGDDGKGEEQKEEGGGERAELPTEVTYHWEMHVVGRVFRDLLRV